LTEQSKQQPGGAPNSALNEGEKNYILLDGEAAKANSAF
jgi:hypothetical protein